MVTPTGAAVTPAGATGAAGMTAIAGDPAIDDTSLVWQRLHPVTVLREVLGLAWNLVFAVLVFGDVDVSDVSFEFVAGVGVVALAVGRYLSTRYCLTDEAFLYRRGIVVRRRVTIPRNRVQNVSNGSDVIGRLFGLRTVTVSSAGSEGEVKLALLRVEEAETLVVELLQRPAGSVVDGAIAPTGAHTAGEVRVLHRAGAADLVRYGLTGPFPALLLIAAVFMAVAVAVGRGPLAAAATAAPLIFAGFSVLDLVGFRLAADGDRIVVRHGLLATKERWARRERVQVLGVDRSWLRAVLGYESVSVSTADATVEGDATLRLAAPIAPIGTWRSLASELLEPVELDEAALRPVSRLAVRRRTVRWSIVLGLFVGLPLSVAVALVERLDSRWLLATAVAVPWAWVSARRSWRVDGYAIDPDHVLIRRGTWDVHAWLVRRDKVQTVTVTSTLFQRRLGLATVIVDTAAVRNGAAVLADLPSAEAEELAAELVDHAARVHLADGV